MGSDHESNRRRHTAFVPTLSEARVRTIREWHEQAYRAMKQRGTAEVSYLGRSFVVPPQVFGPTPMSDLLGNAVLREVRSTDRVLDMGTGCGVNAVLAAATAAEVVGVDINPHALRAARDNAERNGVASRATFFESDVFDRVEGCFDLIVFDPPFRWFAPRDILEASIADRDYTALRAFFAGVGRHLAERGRILLFFGTSGDIDYLERLVAASGFRKEVVAERSLHKEGVEVGYFTYRLMR